MRKRKTELSVVENVSEDVWAFGPRGTTTVASSDSAYKWTDESLLTLVNACETIKTQFEAKGIALTAGSLRQGLEFVLCGLNDGDNYSDWAQF